MEHRGTDEKFQFGSDFTVKECLSFIEHCDCIGSAFSCSTLNGATISSFHDLYLVKEANTMQQTYSSTDGIRMHSDKLLSSYRLKPGVRYAQ